MRGIFLWLLAMVLLWCICRVAVMKKCFIFLLVFCMLCAKSYAVPDAAPLVVESNYMDYVNAQKKKTDKQKPEKSSDPQQITMSALNAVQIAGQFIDVGDYDQATRILTMMPETNNLSVEIERWYLLAQIAQRQGDYDTAIKIYRKILDDQPDLVKIRYELALCYMHEKKWYRADYHLRLAMAGNDIPDPVKKMMFYHRYVIRQNKNWNVWFNFGAVPDNNINQVAGGEECITNEFGTFCHQLPDPISAVGYDMTLGGNYEFKLGEHWRWKNDANLYSNIYNQHDYDDLYLGASTGPRYVWDNGDVWVAGIFSRRFYGWDGYNLSYGGKIDANYDISRRWGAGLSLVMTNNLYDDFAEYMNGQTYSGNSYVSYSFDASKYLVLRTGVAREYAKNDIYKNWRYTVALGFGAELPLGFHVYIEPSLGWTRYDGARWAVVNNDYIKITEHDFMHRYSVSLSNNKFDIWGFVPTLTFGYTRRDSNIKNRGYDKMAIEFHMQQRF